MLADNASKVMKPQSERISCEVIDSAELSKRWDIPETWVREQTRSRAIDPIPHLRFGRYVRFQWGDPELAKWLDRRRNRP